MPMKEVRSRSRAGRTMTRSRTRSSQMYSLRDLFEEELKDLYNAEQQIVKSLPKLANAVSSPDLKNAFEHHLEQNHNRLRQALQLFKR